MRIIHEDKKKGLLKIAVDNEQDLWYLAKLIRSGDKVSAHTYRAVRIGDKEERKRVFLSLVVETVEFRKEPSVLRVRGKILEGRPEEYVQAGRYHSIDIREGTALTIEKDWKEYEVELIREAVKKSRERLLSIVLIDEKHYLVIDVGAFGYTVKYEEELPSSKRLEERALEREKKKAYEKIASSLDKNRLILVAGPGFEKDKLAAFLKEKGFAVKVASTGYAEVSAVKELIDKGIVESSLGEARLDREAKLVEDTLKHIYKDDGLAVYGKDAVKRALDMGAVEQLLVGDKLLGDEEVRELIGNVEKRGGRVAVISADHDWGRMLMGLTGIVAKLHFPID